MATDVLHVAIEGVLAGPLAPPHLTCSQQALDDARVAQGDGASASALASRSHADEEVLVLATGALTYGETNGDTMRLAGEVMLHVANRCAGDASIGTTRLNAALWRAEVRCYAELGQVLTGSRYVALAQGPALDGYDDVLDCLARDGAAITELAGGQPVVRPLREADLSAFTTEQVAVLNEVIEQDRHKTASQVAEASRGIAWQIGLNDDTGIAYEAYWISDDPLTDKQRARVLELIQQFGW